MEDELASAREKVSDLTKEIERYEQTVQDLENENSKLFSPETVAELENDIKI